MALLTFIQFNICSVDVNARTTFEDTFRCTFHDQQVSIVTIAGFVNRHLIFVRRVERNFDDLSVLLTEFDHITNLKVASEQRETSILSSRLAAYLLPIVRRISKGQIPTRPRYILVARQASLNSLDPV